MSSFITDLATYIATNTSLTLNTDIFAGGYLTTSPQQAVAVTYTESTERIESGLVSETVRVLVRSTSYNSARTLAYTIYDLIKNSYGIKLSNVGDGHTIKSHEFISTPYLLARDRHLFMFAVDFRVNRSEGY